MRTPGEIRETIRAALQGLSGWAESGASVDRFGEQSQDHHKRWSLGIQRVEYDSRQNGHLVATSTLDIRWSYRMRITDVQGDQTAALNANDAILGAIRATGLPVLFDRMTVSTNPGENWQMGRLEAEVTHMAPYPPLARTAPLITGSPNVGSTLEVGPGTYGNTAGSLALSYQWYRDGAAISGATSATYSLAGADLGAEVHATETATTGAGAMAQETPAVGPIQASLTDLRVAVIQPAEHATAYSGAQPTSYRQDVSAAFDTRSESIGAGYGLEAGLVAATARDTYLVRAATLPRLALIEQEHSYLSGVTNPVLVTGFEDQSGSLADGGVSIVEEFGSPLTNIDGQGRAEWLKVGEEVVLRATHPANAYGASNSGVSLWREFGPVDEAWCSYLVRFVEGHSFHQAVIPSCKSPRLVGDQDVTPGSPSDGTRASGWAGGFQFKGFDQDTGIVLPDNKIRGYQYLYYKGMAGNFGDNVLWTDPDTGSAYEMDIGTWYLVQQRVKINTGLVEVGSGGVANADGISEVWVAEVVDGYPQTAKQVLYLDDVHWTDEENLVGTFKFNNFLGGASADYEIPTDSDMDFARVFVTAQAERPAPGPLPNATVYVCQSGDDAAALGAVLYERRKQHGAGHIVVFAARDAGTLAAAEATATDQLAGVADCTSLDLADPADMDAAGTAVLAVLEALEAKAQEAGDELLTPGQLASLTALEGVELTAGTPATIGAPTLSYQWQRDGADIPGATSQTYTPVFADRTAVLRRGVSDGVRTYYSQPTSAAKVLLKSAKFQRAKYLKGAVPSSITGDWTATFHMRVTDLATASPIFGAWESAATGFFGTTFNATNLVLAMRQEVGANVSVDGSFAVGEWCHVALRHNDGAGTEQILVGATVVEDSAAASTVTPTQALVLGAREDGGVADFLGDIEIADFRLYSTAKTDEEIADIATGATDSTGLVDRVALAGAALSLPAGWSEVGTGTAVSLADGPPSIWID